MIRLSISILDKLIFTLMVIISLAEASAQAPQKFDFQGIARTQAGNPVANTEIGYSFKLHDNTPAGPELFSSQGTVVTDQAGVFSLSVGTDADPIPDGINWANHKIYLRVAIDSDGPINGISYTDLGTRQLLSVPYALYANEAEKWRDDVPILQKGSDLAGAPDLPTVGNGPVMLWYPKKSAFRAGYATSNSWENNQIGRYTFASGYGTRATSDYSVAMGQSAAAFGEASVAIGQNALASQNNSVALGTAVTASGLNAFAIGSNSAATGANSFALGSGLFAKSVLGFALGVYNDNSDSPAAIATSTDRIFQVGNGSAGNARSNAMTVLRNGNIGIGENVLTPQYLLDVGGRARIRHNGATAGIHFNDSQNVADGFAGMRSDTEIGLWVNNGWRFWVNSSSAFVSGALVQTSDRRLKKNLVPITGSLSGIRKLQGYFFNWIDSGKDQGKQTGLMAQEVEEVFPELVATDSRGYKAVNYIGLIPHLIEAVKELDLKTERINSLLNAMGKTAHTGKNTSK